MQENRLCIHSHGWKRALIFDGCPAPNLLYMCIRLQQTPCNSFGQEHCMLLSATSELPTMPVSMSCAVSKR